MEYQIKSIKHSGRKGERGTDRIDGRYPMRIGRTVYLDISKIIKGKSFYLDYIKNSDGSDYSTMGLWTSLVIDKKNDGKTVIIETINTIYEFEKVVNE